MVRFLVRLLAASGQEWVYGDGLVCGVERLWDEVFSDDRVTIDGCELWSEHLVKRSMVDYDRRMYYHGGRIEAPWN